MAANTDKFRKVVAQWTGSIGSAGVNDAVVTTIPLASVSNIPTDTAVMITVNRVNSLGVRTGNYEGVVGVISGNNLINCLRGVEGTAQAWTGGTVVEILATADNANDLIDGILVEHSQLGVHTKATGATVNTGTANDTFVTPKAIADSDISTGWTSARETWEWVSVDDPTGTFRVNADVTGILSLGMKIKFTNGGNVIYGIITNYGAYTGGYTSVSFLHQIDPADNLALVLMANSAITLPYYSTQKAPYGFPCEPTKWQIVVKDTATRTTNTPTQNIWYNTNSILLTLPVGSWKLGYNCLAGVGDSAATAIDVQTALSTANNSVSDADFLSYVWWNGASATLEAISLVTKEKEVNVAGKTIYYLIQRTTGAGITNIFWFGGATGATTTIKATCAYL